MSAAPAPHAAHTMRPPETTDSKGTPLPLRDTTQIKVYAVLCLLTIACVYIQTTKLTRRLSPYTVSPDSEAFRIGSTLFPAQAYVIALEETHGTALSARFQAALSVSTHFIQADTGRNHSNATHLFTRYMMDTERVDHKLIGNAAMIGCLMSHVQIWRAITEPVFIFEEDAVLGNETRAMIAHQLYEARMFNWSILMLTTRAQSNLKGAVTDISPLLATCTACDWFGTRGYIITPAGAAILLEYHTPLLLQVDGLISLVNSYDDRFQMIWVRDDTIRSIPDRPSTIQTKACPRCYHIWEHMDPINW